MALTVSEALAATEYSSGSKTASLTVPTGAKALVVCFGGDEHSALGISAVSFGGLAMTFVAGDTPSGPARVGMWELLDIDGRADDDLEWTAVDTHEVQATFLVASKAHVSRINSGTASGSTGNVTISSGDPYGLDGVAIVVGSVIESSTSEASEINPYTGMTMLSEIVHSPGSPASWVTHVNYRTLTSTQTIGTSISGGGGVSGAIAAGVWVEWDFGLRQALAPTALNGPGNTAITLPDGTRGLVIMFGRNRSDGDIASVTFGNEPCTAVGNYVLTGGSTTNHGRAIMYEYLDMDAARDDDNVRFTNSGTGNDYVMAVFAIVGTGLVTRLDDDLGASSAALDPSGGLGCVAVCVSAVTQPGADTGWISPYGSLTQMSEGLPPFGDIPTNYAYALNISASFTVGVVSSSGSAKRGFVGALYSEVVGVQMEEMPGARAGIPDGFEVAPTSDVMILADFRGVVGARGGIPDGFRVTAEGPTAVYLGVPYEERPQFTDTPEGIDVPVLRYRTARKAHWAELADLMTEAGGGGGGTGVHGELTELTDDDHPQYALLVDSTSPPDPPYRPGSLWYDPSETTPSSGGGGGGEPQVTVYTTSGSPHTWTKPAGLIAMLVEVVGGGGGSGGNAATAAGQGASSGGGGGGGYASKTFLASDLPSTCAATVGAGGTAASAGANNGGNAANSTFAGTGITTVQGDGGTGGAGSAASAADQVVSSGTGGAASGGDVNIAGQRGGLGEVWDGDGHVSGSGGGSRLGPSMRAGNAGVAIAGVAYGGGAGGSRLGASASAVAGAAGADGVIIVTEWIATSVPVEEGGVIGYWQDADPGTPTLEEALWFDTDDDSPVASGESAGTVFPTSPLDHTRFYRTDHRMWFRWNATHSKWLSEQRFWLQFGQQDISAAAVSGPGMGFDAAGLDVWLERMECTGRVSGGTHNASNYWLYRLYSNLVGSGGGGDTVVHTSQTTFAVSATTMQNMTNGNIDAVLDVSVSSSIIVVAEEQGASGTFRGYGTLFWRYIGV